MMVVFTDEEWKWIDVIPNDWKIKPGCPQSVKEAIERKFALMNGEFDAHKGNLI